MKKLLIAILFINMAQAQVPTRTVNVREIAGGLETLYHVFDNELSVFNYNPPYSIAQPLNEYPISITYSPGGVNSTGVVRVNNKDYVISGDYARDLNIFISNIHGVGEVYNANRVEVENALLNIPETLAQIAGAGWRYSSNGGGTVFSPNGLYETFYEGNDEWLVSSNSSNPITFDFYATSQQDVIDWYNCVKVIADPTRQHILECRD